MVRVCKAHVCVCVSGKEKLTSPEQLNEEDPLGWRSATVRLSVWNQSSLSLLELHTHPNMHHSVIVVYPTHHTTYSVS